ncbi:transposase [Streptomyces sp. NPDC052415]|uniref:transposase n=1 Tax=Streptomyces sp. NPDC052415 TaxID=3365690 RepID=UPI0037D29B14
MGRQDLTGQQWGRMEPQLPSRGRPPRGRRQVFNAIWWRSRTRSPWRDLPPWLAGDGQDGLPGVEDAPVVGSREIAVAVRDQRAAAPGTWPRRWRTLARVLV